MAKFLVGGWVLSLLTIIVFHEPSLIRNTAGTLFMWLSFINAAIIAHFFIHHALRALFKGE
jgi:hypothetical protein